MLSLVICTSALLQAWFPMYTDVPLKWFWNSIIYKKAAEDWNREAILPTTVSDTNLVHFMLLLVICTSALLQAWFPTYTDVPLKQFWMQKILHKENYKLWRLVVLMILTCDKSLGVVKILLTTEFLFFLLGKIWYRIWPLQSFFW